MVLPYVALIGWRLKIMIDEPKYKNNELQSFHIDPAAPEVAWKALQEKCPFLSDWGVEKLRDGLDGHVQSIVLEPYYMCKDHRNLYSNFYSKKFLEVTSNCNRLHFFSRANVEGKALLTNPEDFQADYVGFSVIRPVRTRCLGRTVIDPYKIGKGIKNEHYLLRAAFKVHINGTEFTVHGYPFTAQDADATLCAHSALWGVCRYLSQRYPHYRALYPFDFIRMTENSRGRAFPYRGMTYTDYCKILSDFGTSPIYGLLQRKDYSTFSAQELMDLPKFVNTLKQQADPVSVFVWKMLSEKERIALANYNSSAPDTSRVQEVVVQILNRIIGKLPVYESKRFESVSLRPETTALVALNPTGASLSRLNRMLLEDAYPQELSKMRSDAAGTVVFDNEAFRDLYSYVESGFPVLASLRLPAGGHVVSLIGHTVDYKKPVAASTGFIDSSYFVKQFVVADDNFFPYQLLGYEDDVENYAEGYDEGGRRVSIESIVTMTCPLAEKVFVPAEDARKKALKHCEKFLSTLKLSASEPFVTRLFVTNSSSFKKRKLAYAKSGRDRACSLVVNLHLPHFVWVMEVSPLALYEKGLCTAEILLDATAGAAEEGVIYVRIGKQMYFAGERSTVWKKIEDAPEQFPQYTHNLGEKNAA